MLLASLFGIATGIGVLQSDCEPDTANTINAPDSADTGKEIAHEIRRQLDAIHEAHEPINEVTKETYEEAVRLFPKAMDDRLAGLRWDYDDSTWESLLYSLERERAEELTEAMCGELADQIQLSADDSGIIMSGQVDWIAQPQKNPWDVRYPNNWEGTNYGVEGVIYIAGYDHVQQALQQKMITAEDTREYEIHKGFLQNIEDDHSQETNYIIFPRDNRFYFGSVEGYQTNMGSGISVEEVLAHQIVTEVYVACENAAHDIIVQQPGYIPSDSIPEFAREHGIPKEDITTLEQLDALYQYNAENSAQLEAE